MAIIKRCTACGFEKPFWDFHYQKAGKDGRTSQCKECVNAYTRSNYERLKRQRKGDLLEEKTCTTCGEMKNLGEFHRNVGKTDGRTSRCKDCTNKWHRERHKGPDYQARKTAYRKANKERLNEQAKEYQLKLKLAAMDAYGGRYCACCGESEMMFLAIDHIHNDGAEHRKQTGRSSRHLTTWLRNNGYPPGFQVLCQNCNWGKHVNGGTCPHESAGGAKPNA